MGNEQTWDAGFELVPSNGDALSSAPLMFAGMTEGIRERVAHEHEMTVGSNNLIHGRHLEGSVVAFYQSTCPLTHPDGEDLGDDDIGLIWYDSGKTTLKVWMGADAETQGWEPISIKMTGLGDDDALQVMNVEASASRAETRAWWWTNRFAGLSNGLYPASGMCAPSGLWQAGGHCYSMVKTPTDATFNYMISDQLLNFSISAAMTTTYARFMGGFHVGE